MSPVRLVTLFVVVVVVWPRPAYAYVDPGLGGMLYQIGYLVVAATIGYFAFLRDTIRSWFRRRGFDDRE